MPTDFELNDRQVKYLVKLRRNKRNLLLGSYGAFLIMFLFIFLIPLGGLFMLFETNGNTWLAKHSIQIIGFLFLAFMVYKVIGHFFLKIIIPLNKDIKLRTGVLEPRQIIRKQYFPMTGHAYFFFAETEMLNITVDEPTFHHFEPGDYISIKKAKHSKIVFEDVDRQEINTEHRFEDQDYFHEHLSI